MLQNRPIRILAAEDDAFQLPSLVDLLKLILYEGIIAFLAPSTLW